MTASAAGSGTARRNAIAFAWTSLWVRLALLLRTKSKVLRELTACAGNFRFTVQLFSQRGTPAHRQFGDRNEQHHQQSPRTAGRTQSACPICGGREPSHAAELSQGMVP